jgi:hypothetical protein
MSKTKNAFQKFESTPLGRLFILKIIHAKPEPVELAEWLELIFGLHEREIVQYLSTRDFKVPGFYKPVPHVRIAGLHIPRTVTCEQRIWARFDFKYPNAIDIEAPIQMGKRRVYNFFQLTKLEWDEVKNSLEPVRQTNRLLDEQTKKHYEVFEKKACP